MICFFELAARVGFRHGWRRELHPIQDIIFSVDILIAIIKQQQRLSRSGVMCSVEISSSAAAAASSSFCAHVHTGGGGRIT